MADVFGRQDQVLAGGLSSDSMFMSWPDLADVGSGLGLLIQRVGLDYRQGVRRIFEIGPGIIPGTAFPAALCDVPANANLATCANRTQPTYYIVSRPEGRMQFNRFVGPNALSLCFYRKYGSPCSPNVITLSGRAGCNAASAQANPLMTWIMNGVLIEGLNMDVTAQEMVIQEGISAMFAGLNIRLNGQDPQC